MSIKKNMGKGIRLLPLIIIFFCAVLVFGGTVSSYLNRFNQTLKEENIARMAEVSENVKVYMNTVVEDTLETLSISAGVLPMLDENEWSGYLEQITSRKGLVYTGYAGADGIFHTAGQEKLVDISKEEYFTRAMQGESVVTGIVQKILQNGTASGVILAAPITNKSGEAVGIIAGMLDMAQIENALKMESFGGAGHFYVIDQEGNLIIHKKSMDYNNFFHILNNVTFASGYSREKVMEDVAAQREGEAFYSNFGMERYVYYHPLDLNGWMVVTIVNREALTAKTDMLVSELVWLSAVMVIVFITLLLLVTVFYWLSESRRRATEAKSTFLANMSHDIRTPMNAIMGMTAIASANISNPDKVEECLGKIMLSSKHLLSLINDVLDMSRIERGKVTLAKSPVALSEILENMVNITQPLIKEKRQEFTLRRHNVEHEWLYCDELRLSQVFINILSNAVKFTPEEGRITVDVEELVSQKPDYAYYRFTFTDTGIGMSKEFAKDIFEAFSRERDSKVDSVEGSGLGMAIAKRIVDMLDGSIQVISEVGKGSTFVVELPLELDRQPPKQDKEKEAGASEAKAEKAYDFTGDTLLLVEDNEMNREIATQILEGMGAVVECACDGEEGCRRFLESRPGYYAAVLMDIQMPVMNGYEATKRIRSMKREDAAAVPILALTADAFAEDVQRAKEAGMNGHVVKPIDIDFLARQLSYWIKERNMKNG